MEFPSVISRANSWPQIIDPGSPIQCNYETCEYKTCKLNKIRTKNACKVHGNGATYNGNSIKNDDHPQQSTSRSYRRKSLTLNSRSNTNCSTDPTTPRSPTSPLVFNRNFILTNNNIDHITTTPVQQISTPQIASQLNQRRLLCRHYYPEGGWGWVIATVGVIVQILTHGIQLSYSQLIIPTSKKFHIPPVHSAGKLTLY